MKHGGVFGEDEGGPGSGPRGGAPGTNPDSHKDNMMHLIDKHESLSRNAKNPVERAHHARTAARLNASFKSLGYDKESKREAREQSNRNYVQPRYSGIKPEGEINDRDFVKSGTKGGGHAGGGDTIESKSSRAPATMEGKKGWTARQRSMHSTMGKKLAAGK